MIISLIVAMDRNGVIGKDGTIPWHLSSDLQHFRKITMGKPIVMGRKTHESIGRPLPGRENIVVTRDGDFHAPGCTVLHAVEDVFNYCGGTDEIMIMGGADLYKQALDKAGRIYLTEVHTKLDGDTFFPKYDRESWEEVERYDFRADEKNEYDYSFVILEKNQGE